MGKFNHAVVIGRFQPFHTGHLGVINRALEEAETCSVLIGSSHKAPDIKNPFSYKTREKMILDSLSADASERVLIHPIRDQLYSDPLWVARVQQAVSDSKQFFGKRAKKDTTVLVGHEKDFSSYYLKMFGWPLVDPGMHIKINATELRYAFLENGGNMADELPIPVREILARERMKPEYERLKEELAFLKSYWKTTQVGPYPVQFQTVDAVIIASGHILMIKRGGHPGKGLYALPGGYVQDNETIERAVYRELLEETNLRVDRDTLKSSLTSRVTYDAPQRDLRGRIITTAFTFRLPDNPDLPKIAAGDDAAFAYWMPVADLLNSETECFADHYHIAITSLGLR